MINAALLGFGTVGSNVYSIVQDQAEDFTKKLGTPLFISAILTRRSSPNVACRVTHNFADILNDQSINLVIEVMGGIQPALDYTLAALSSGRHVVSANKELIAHHGPEIFACARQHGVHFRFDASVCGGMPVLPTLSYGLYSNRITSIAGILNGTCNSILSTMENNDLDFQAALANAQTKGFAEADPTKDIDGRDSVYKIAILASLIWGRHVDPSAVAYQGIQSISALDAQAHKADGYSLKLIAYASEEHCFVKPIYVNNILHSVCGGDNGVLVQGDILPNYFMMGPGAGEATASAVINDVLSCTLLPISSDNTWSANTASRSLTVLSGIPELWKEGEPLC